MDTNEQEKIYSQWILGEEDKELSTENKSKSTEEFIIDIYKKLLKKDNVQKDDNFFLLGGDSLHMIKFFKILNHKYPNLLTIEDLYLYTTPCELTEFIQKQQNVKKRRI